MAGRHYDTDELQLIVILRNRGLSIPAVARELGRTSSGIQGALRARGWVDPARSRSMRSARVFSAEQREALRQFVRSWAGGHTPSDIRDEWNREAITKTWPVVNNGRVLYYLRELGLQKTKKMYMQFESYRSRQSAAQKTRRAKEQEALRRVLRIRRDEIYACEPDLARRKCAICGETWPLTKQFFRNAGGSAKYFLKRCRFCDRGLGGSAAERCKLRMDAYDRHVIVKQISAAKAERDAFLRKHRNFPTRRCSCCHETWELVPERYPRYRSAAGGELYRRTCRFCLRTSARLKERAKTVADRISITTVEGDQAARRSANREGRMEWCVQ